LHQEKDVSLLVGLTGGIGSGKTLAASIFKNLGAIIIDADILCRELVMPGQPALQEIAQRFGHDILNSAGELDRKELASIVFQDANSKKDLENILHPLVFAEEQRFYQAICQPNPHALVIIDAALLIESGNYKNVDKVILVACDEENQIQRVLKRGGFNREEVSDRIRSQMPLAEKRKFADYIIENDSTEEHLRESVEKLSQKLFKIAAG
jgi:dephospho-CoA kinase